MMTGIVLAKYGQTKYPYALVSTVHNELQRSVVLMGLADRVIAVSRAVARSMVQRGIPGAKIRVVCNGTLNSPRDRFSAAASLPPVSLQRLAITTVAGMYQRKGIAELIAAFEQVTLTIPKVHLYLVGNGPDRPKFMAQAQRTAVADRIHFEGFQPQPVRYLQATDVFVLASHQEPFGLVLSEARAARCAIVASQVDGIPEALDSGEAGLLVPPGHIERLANTISQLLSDPGLLNAWKSRSHQNLEWTQVSRMHQETLAVYQELKPIVCTQ
ncbi:glycosyltransferase family 4 protein [Leptodesmis sp.]|uniref:glycosyltransferase family 4 protein n=1 Tax=Leptodesmis sp. TaxID=3100501 RepID=UPI0040534E36